MPVTFSNTPVNPSPAPQENPVEEAVESIYKDYLSTKPSMGPTKEVVFVITGYITTKERDSKFNYELNHSETKNTFDAAEAYFTSLKEYYEKRLGTDLTGYRIYTTELHPLDWHMVSPTLRKELCCSKFQVTPKVYVNGPKKDLAFLKKKGIYVTEKGT